MKRSLLDQIISTTLFDHRYYNGFDSSNRSIQAIHYLNYGFKEFINPHPIFNIAYYYSRNKDIRDGNIEPLTHYLRHGRWEGRSPHPLFDTNFYLQTNKDVVQDGVDPLSHFVNFGIYEGRSPSPEIDLDLYREHNPDFLQPAIDVARLITWHEKLKENEIKSIRTMRRKIYTPPVTYNRNLNNDSRISTIHVQCVYGPQHAFHIENVLIPSLSASTQRNVIFSCIAYKPDVGQISSERADARIIVHNIDNPGVHYGFAAAHNEIFKDTDPQDVFILVNPDCVLQTGSIDALISRYLLAEIPIGIVEGRQWPFEHPKEYNTSTLETPWASGAFCLINAEMYKKVGGMDDIYFLYLEDVDLSWQSWLSGYPVIYERDAVAIHFSGGRFYRNDMIEAEKYFSLRNFIIICRKFLGTSGEEQAFRYLRKFPDKALVDQAILDYNSNYANIVDDKYERAYHPKIKVYNVCQFHKMRLP